MLGYREKGFLKIILKSIITLLTSLLGLSEETHMKHFTVTVLFKHKLITVYEPAGQQYDPYFCSPRSHYVNAHTNVHGERMKVFQGDGQTQPPKTCKTAQNWTQHSKCGLTSAEQKGRITSLHLLATTLLMRDHLLQPNLLAFFSTKMHCWLMCNLVSTRTPRGAFQPVSPHCVLVPGVIPPQGQHFAFPLVELRDSSVLQAVEVPLDGSTTIWRISHSSQVCIVCEFTADAPCLIVEVINEDVEQHWLQLERKVKIASPITGEPYNAAAEGDSRRSQQRLSARMLCGPLQVLEGCCKVSLKPSLLQAEQPQLSQPVFIGEVLQPSDHLRGPPLDSLQQVDVLLMLGAPELNAVLQAGSRKSRIEGQNHLPQPAGHASFDAAQDTVGFLGCKRTLPGHVELLINQHPEVLLLRATLNPFSAQPVFVLGIAPTHVQDLALGLCEVHTGPPLKPVKVPLDGIPSHQCVNRTTQLGVVGRLAEGALDPTVHVTDKDVKQHWSQYQPLRNATCHWSPLGHRAVDHNSLSATIQPIPYPPSGPSIRSISLQFRDKDVMRDSVKCFAQVQDLLF
ncbi:hypothetical protein QYF61_002293 [Mycteria americana]|uniref:Uncharacterized protein n=1 Tax=Mycteria americana TaxID=33587 RepID=A0AAN7S046_MYCAM|nr:hypothetical protein QYF61_002293 [Mycteria americana]